MHVNPIAEGLYDVVLEESVDIQPHTGNAHVELSLVGDEPEDEAMEDSVYSGLSVVYVGIKPTGMALDCPGTFQGNERISWYSLIHGRL